MECRNWIFICLLLVLRISGNRGCLEAERLALLEFKEFLHSKGYDADHILPSWIDHPDSECCDWERVTCNHSTSHVIELSLHDIRQPDGISPVFWNISLFQPFEELRVLNLSFNGIMGWIENKGSENLLRLQNLEILDLYVNQFNESIIPSLKGLTSLRILNLSLNSFGLFPATDLSSLENLETLHLSFCGLNGSLADTGFDNSSKLSKLKYLDLSDNYITKNMLGFLGKLSSLNHLDLTFNGFEGSFPIYEFYNLSDLEVLLVGANRINDISSSFQNSTALNKLQILDLSINEFNSIPPILGALTSLKAISLFQNSELNDSSSIQVLCRLKGLEELDLSYNQFTGLLPSCLNNLTSLTLLDLSSNGFTGVIPSSWMAGLTSLNYIDLGINNFEGLFSLSSFANHSNLEVIRFRGYNDNFRIETEDSDWFPQFQLKVLVLSQCNLNKFTNKIPNFLLHQNELILLDLSNNKLAGNFPSWLLANNSRLEVLNLRNNSFTGEFNMPPSPMVTLVSMDVSDNQIQGQIPENIGKILLHLEWLVLSQNAFEGNIPSSFGDIRNLKGLDMSFNSFTGEVPEAFSCELLQMLKLSNNNFSGNFFLTRNNLSALTDLKLNNNKFTGSFTDIEVNLNAIYLFDISNNFMSGRIPSWIGNMTSLTIIDMGNNAFEGEVPCEVLSTGPKSGKDVDLSHNFLSSLVPSCTNIGHVSGLYLQGNNITGSIPKEFVNASLIALNMRDNSLSGSIPQWIDGLSGMRILLLAGNHLSGIIPENLCILQSIRLLDLSNNNLSGPIPRCLHNISFGELGPDIGVGANSASSSIGPTALSFQNLLKKDFNVDECCVDSVVQAEFDFVTKNRRNSYKGDIVGYFSGLDLSSNKLVGEIPPALGNLSQIHALNLSHNDLTGSIPSSFSNLTQIESLDLSRNSLSGEIPSGLIGLTFLEVFSVAHNNLSGRIPDGKAQFGTFDKSSYEGNPFLCGPPLEKGCSQDEELPTLTSVSTENESDGKWYEIDPVFFFASFSASFIIFFLGVIAFLYVNPYWRQRVFYVGEKLVFKLLRC